MAEDDEQFWNKIIMSDEDHFTLNGTVNKQNCRIYATETPREIQEGPLHGEKVTVWCGVLVSTRRRFTAHKSHNNRFSEEIVSGPFDVEKW